MPSTKDNISLLLGIAIGSLLYVVLNFIPLIGPFLAGVTAGKISRKGLKRGLLAGFFSGIIGSLLIFLIFFNWLYSWNILGKFLVGGVLLVWNLVGVILTTLGGAMSILTSEGGRSFFNFHRFTPETEEKDPERKILVVCKNCKVANPKGREYCSSCGEKL